MKNIINIKYLAFAFSTFGLLSCDSLLDVVPDNRTEIDTPEKIQELLVNAYPDGLYFLVAESMSDNAEDKINFTEINRLNDLAYHWKDNLEEIKDTPTHYWRAAYEAVSVANQAIKSVENLGDTKDLQAFKGEALVARAYAHFTLGMLWAKPYNSATADTDIALPYADQVETKVLVNYPRLSVKDFYAAIERDLEKGIPLINNSIYQKPKFRFTKQAAHAFASRFYLSKGDWQKALDHANQVLTPLNDVRNYLRNINQISSLTYSQKAQRYSSVNEPANLLIVGASSLTQREYATTKYGLTQNLQSQIYSRNTHPLGLNWAYSFYGGENYQNRSKFVEYFRYTNISAGYGYSYTMATLISYDEVLLNRAEANLMLGNYQSVVDDINLYLPNKTQGDITTPLTEVSMDAKYKGKGIYFEPNYTLDTKQREWLQCLVDLRRAEFIHEGIRWFDIKRLGMPVTHISKNGTFELRKNDPRRELQLPEEAINQGIKANPR